MRSLASTAIWRIKFRKRVQGIEPLVRFLLANGGVWSLFVDDSLCDSADHASVAKLKGSGVMSGAYHAAVFDLL
jgi:hypothetical protein